MLSRYELEIHKNKFHIDSKENIPKRSTQKDGKDVTIFEIIIAVNNYSMRNTNLSVLITFFPALNYSNEHCLCHNFFLNFDSKSNAFDSS